MAIRKELMEELRKEERKMSLWKLLMHDPGMDCKNEWLLPKLLRALYTVGSALAILAVVLGVVNVMFGGWPPVLGCVVIPFGAIFLIVSLRLVYETGILLFRMFESEREIIRELQEQQETVVQVGQYMCERLAEISEGVGRIS